MAQNHSACPGWWRQFQTSAEQSLQWEIGPLKLAARRLAHEV